MIVIREAEIKDNDGLLNLTSLTPMDGRVSIRIDRNPDFFSLFHLRGPGKIFLAEKDKKILGCFSLSIMDFSVFGIPEKIYYLADLKILPDYFGKTVAFRLIHHMHNYLLTIGAELLFSTVIYGNIKVMPLFNGRTGIPHFKSLGRFNVYQIIPVKRRIEKEIEIKETGINQDLINFYSKFYTRYEFTPQITEKYLEGAINIVAATEEIRASVSLVDVSDYKQNVLVRLPLALKILIWFIQPINRLLGIFTIPVKEKPIRILYIKAFGYRDGDERLLNNLIQYARNWCVSHNYSFLSVAIHEKDPMTEIFRKYLHFNFTSLGYITDLTKKTGKVSGISTGLIFEDFSLV